MISSENLEILKNIGIVQVCDGEDEDTMSMKGFL